VFTVLTGTISV